MKDKGQITMFIIIGILIVVLFILFFFLYEEITLSTYYKGVNVSYLCYNSNYYYPCINQEQMLIQHLKEELHNVLANDVKNCLDDLVIVYLNRVMKL